MPNSIHAKRYALCAAVCTLAVSFGVIAAKDNEFPMWLISLAGSVFTFIFCYMVIPYHEDGSK